MNKKELHKIRIELMRDLARKDGHALSAADIGYIFGITRQRVYQIVSEPFKAARKKLYTGTRNGA